MKSRSCTEVKGGEPDRTERGRAEGSLRISEEKFSKAFRCSPDPITISTLSEGRFLEVNDSFLQMMEYTRQEVIGHTSTELKIWPDPESRSRLRQMVERQGAVRNLELEFRVKSGQRHVGLFSAEIIELEGEPCLLVAMRDITAQKRAEEETRARARQQEAVAHLGRCALAGADLSALMDEAVRLVAQGLQTEYSDVLELLPDGHAFLFRAGVGWSQELIDLATLSADPDSLAGFTLLSDEPVIVQDYRSEPRFRIPPLVHDQRLVSGLSVIILGQDRPFGLLCAHTTGQRLFTGDDIHFLQTVATVLAEAISRRQAEGALRQSKERFRQIFDHSNDAIFVVDPARDKILDVNPQACRLLKYSREELLVLPMSTIHPDEMEKLQAFVHAVSAQGGGRSDELTCLAKTGEKIPAEISASPIKINGQPCLLALVRDVTERRRAEAALRQAHAELERRVQERTAELAQTNALLEKSRDDMLSIINQLRLGSAMTDPDGCLTFLSEAAQRVFGACQKEILGQHWERVFPFQAQDKAQLKAMFERPPMQRTRIPAYLETAEGARYWMEIDLQDDPHDPRRKIFLFYDVSEVHDLKPLPDEEPDFGNLVGKSKLMKLVYQQICDLARLDSTVLIEGETGAGKGLVARAIHDWSDRKGKPFIPVNCAGLTESLLGSQLFGHRRGAFTGAFETQQGLFEAANGGTIFLDEIGDMPCSVQTNLLRVLEEREITRLGESLPRKIDVRVIVATNHDLDQEVVRSQFRPDLLYRIRVARIHLPALRERREDIPLLVDFFLRQYRAVTGKPVRDVSQEAMQTLWQYSWPGNVRELKNAIEFALIRCKGLVLNVEDLPPEIIAAVCPSPDAALEQEKQRVLAALEQTKWNHTEAARLLGISRATLYRRIASLQIKPKQ
jgi:PAS domain S-box-containing protein